MYQDYESRRAFSSEIIEAAFFGAFMVAIDARKNEEHLTQAELARRTGREKTGISKLLVGPRNWKLSTISDLAEALDLRLEFVLIDQRNPMRRFTQTGVAFVAPFQNPSSIEVPNGIVGTSVIGNNQQPQNNAALLNPPQNMNNMARITLFDDRINQSLKIPIAV